MSRPSTTPPPWVAAQARWRSHQVPSHLGVGGHDRDGAARPRASGCAGDVPPVDGDPLPHRNGRRPGQCRHRLAVLRWRAQLQRQRGDGPVHGARVEALDAQPLRHRPRDRGLAGAGRPVNGDQQCPGRRRAGGEPLEVLGEGRVARLDGPEPGDQAVLPRTAPPAPPWRPTSPSGGRPGCRSARPAAGRPRR